VLRDAGLEIVERDLGCIDLYGTFGPWQMTSVESRAHYEDLFQSRAGDFDPRVHSRMSRADELTAVGYRQALNNRNAFAEAFAAELGGDFLLMPTTPLLPPKVSDLSDDAEFGRANLLALRNPSLANCADGCSLAMPYRQSGLTLSAMLIGVRNNDAALLGCGKAVEEVLAGLG
ncbi:MAG: amidase family protein, partial [Roseobacter sp.]